LPPLDEAEYAALRDDIAEHGVIYPLVVDEDGNVLDGHHRQAICQELGITPPVEVRRGLTDEQKHELALSLNLQRRHLSLFQRRDLIRQELERNPNRSDRAIGRLLGVDHKTVGAYRRALFAETPEPGGELPTDAETTAALLRLLGEFQPTLDHVVGVVGKHTGDVYERPFRTSPLSYREVLARIDPWHAEHDANADGRRDLRRVYWRMCLTIEALESALGDPVAEP
jgi:ParB-like chromosome segregation protein Spo0J